MSLGRQRQPAAKLPRPSLVQTRPWWTRTIRFIDFRRFLCWTLMEINLAERNPNKGKLQRFKTRILRSLWRKKRKTAHGAARDDSSPRQNPQHRYQCPRIPEHTDRIRQFRPLHLAIYRKKNHRPQGKRHVARPNQDSSFRTNKQRLEKTRISILRPYHTVLLHAKHRHGERPSDFLPFPVIFWQHSRTHLRIPQSGPPTSQPIHGQQSRQIQWTKTKNKVK